MIYNKYDLNPSNSVGRQNNFIGTCGEHFINSKYCPVCRNKMVIIDEPSIDFKCLNCNKNYEVKCIKNNQIYNTDNIITIRGGKYEKLVSAVHKKHIEIILITYSVIQRQMIICDIYQIKNIFLSNHSKIIKLKSGASIIKINSDYLIPIIF